MIYFGEGVKELETHDVLLVKEQVARQKAQDDAGGNAGPVTVLFQFDISPKNIYTVYPEDIKMALQKSDPKVLLYTNSMLLSAKNGEVIAAPGSFGGERVKKDYAFWLSALGILAAAFVLATTAK
jgi:hypothetical protein